MIPTQVMNEFGQSFIHKSRFSRGLIGLATGGPAGLVAGLVSGGGAPDPFTPPDPCPGGIMIRNKCITGDIPLIDVTTVGTTPGTGLVQPGAFGALSVDPLLMTSVRLRCPTGLVLGKDDRCYAQGKGGISNSQRKWPKAPRAIMSAQDGKILRKADAVRNRVKRVAMVAGFSCKKK